MRAKHFFGMILAGTALSAVAVGCGSSEETSTDGGSTSTTAGSGGGSDTSGSGGTGGAGGSGSSSSQVTTTSAGGTEGDNDNTLADASDYDLANPSLADGELSPIGDADYYKISGSKGQAVALIVAAQELEGAAFDPSFPDTFMTLLDKDGKELALNDDPDPRWSNDSQIFTLLPEDGDYFVRIEECWTYKNAHPENTQISCAPPEDKPNTAYQFFAYSIEVGDSIVRDEEKGNDASSATTVTYKKNDNGQYFIDQIFGLFETKGDVDVFAFRPADQAVPNGRPTAYFDTMQPGIPGNGSTSKTGKIYITSAADPTVRIAEISGELSLSIAPPLPLDQDYLFFVEHPGQDLGPNDFYFIQHYVASSNDLEAETVTTLGSNDDWSKAEAVEASQGSTDTVVRYYLEANISNAGSGTPDVDYFKFAIPSTLPAGSKMMAGCVGNYVGSGLDKLTVELLDSDGTTSLGTAKELPGATFADSKDAGVYDVTVPAGATELGLKVTAEGQTAVTSDYYRCGIVIVAAQ